MFLNSQTPFVAQYRCYPLSFVDKVTSVAHPPKRDCFHVALDPPALSLEKLKM